MFAGFKIILFNPGIIGYYNYGPFNDVPSPIAGANQNTCPAPPTKTVPLESLLTDTDTKIPNNPLAWPFIQNTTVACSNGPTNAVLEYPQLQSISPVEAWSRAETNVSGYTVLGSQGSQMEAQMYLQTLRSVVTQTRAGAVFYLQTKQPIVSSAIVKDDDARIVDVVITYVPKGTVDNFWGDPDTGKFGLIVPLYYDAPGLTAASIYGKPQFINFVHQRFFLWD